MRVVFFGSPAFAVPSLTAVAATHDVAAVVTQPDRPAGRGKQLTPPAVKQAAARLGLKVLQPAGVRDDAVRTQLAALVPDVFVVVAYGRILPAALLEVPRLGSWNVHASLLPRYRGAAPIQWAIIRGETRTGVAVMRMEAGLDTGSVAAVRETAIRDDETAGTLADRLAALGAEILSETLIHIASGAVRLTPQDDARATLAPPLDKDAGRLDFGRAAAEVSARARGVDPWPGAWALLDGQAVKLFTPRAMPAVAAGAPGEVMAAGADGLIVACAGGVVAFAEMQLPGRRRMAVSAAVAGRPIHPGARLT